jgi:hypothetical protein
VRLWPQLATILGESYRMANRAAGRLPAFPLSVVHGGANDHRRAEAIGPGGPPRRHAEGGDPDKGLSPHLLRRPSPDA